MSDPRAPFQHWADAFARLRQDRTVVAEPPEPTAFYHEDPARWSPDPKRWSLGMMEVLGKGEALIIRAGPAPDHITELGDAQRRWQRQVQVWVSEKGRSTRVWVDNVEITTKESA